MDVVIIFNGLGNQMSQYAFYLQKKSINKSTRFIFDKKSMFDHNGYELDEVFNINYKDTFENILLYILFRILGVKKVSFISIPLIKVLNFIGIRLVNEKDNYDFDESLLKSKKGITFYYGGWHSEKYFTEIKENVLNTFKFKSIENDIQLLELMAEIKNTNSVSIHIRRGDFLNEINMKTFGSVCTKDYFRTAMNKISHLVDNPHFFVFSNDVKWVKENFKSDSVTIVDFNKSKASWKDMFLISSCNHHINSNSTFSWWGSYLNMNVQKTVIVPRYFINNLETKDFYPDNWLKIVDYK